MKPKSEMLVVGGGIFGITAALELRQRGYQVALLDVGPLPHPLAASTDISKVVRMDYGEDDGYMALGEQARQGWLRWNEQLFAEPLYHEVGVAFLSRLPMSPHSFEYESFYRLQQRGYQPERLSGNDLVARFPAWQAGVYGDGYLNRQAGYVESGRVMGYLVESAKSAGISLYLGHKAQHLLRQQNRIVGVQTGQSEKFFADQTIIAGGSWTPLLVPELSPMMVACGQPIFHLQPTDPTPFCAAQFPVFTADISQTGWYGFPYHPTAGVVKIGNHGRGKLVHPDQDERTILAEDFQRLQTFLQESLPMLANAPLVYSRLCLYCDTLDQHFWIANHPNLLGLTVSAGGSGHAFKFAPVLGALTADAIEGQANPILSRFAWRHLSSQVVGQEAARNRNQTLPLPLTL